MSISKLIISIALVALMAIPAGAALAQVPVAISAGAPLAGAGSAVIWDDVARSDAITYTMTGVTPPEAGTSYEGWVKQGTKVKSTGVMDVAADGSISHTFGSGKQVLVPLKEQNESGQSGWAVLSVNAGNPAQTDVMLTLGDGTLQTQLVHIHSGQCGATLGGVEIGLTSFVGGSGASMTTVDATLISLRSGDRAINTHQAGSQGTYTSCGNIPTEAGALTFALGEMSNSGQSGWATLIANGNQTDVVLDITSGVLQTELVHIHSGQCGDPLGGVDHPLTSFVGGSGGSMATVDVSLASLRDADSAINTHRAGAAGTYTTCGNIPAGNSVYSGENLIREHNEVVITIEPIPDGDPAPSGVVAFSAAIDGGPLAHIRHLLADWPERSGAGILTNLQTQLDVAVLHANLATNSDTIAGIKQHLEHVVNAIEGKDGPNYGDLDGDGATQDFGDGIGVLNHAVDRKHAGFASKDLPETSTIAIQGKLVDEYAMNAHDWAALARDQALQALNQSSRSLIDIFVGPGADTVITLLDVAKNGSDAQGPSAVDAYVAAQMMATYEFAVGAGGTPAPAPSPPATGEAAIPLLATVGLISALILLGAGGLLTLRSRRSRASS